ncbi:hypothetical protein ACD661_16365 [Legionella lytica]|uniref:Uncharacterized protein n=1 Tax=Legionella lytica TaxID=96232 RepID=A0ABW8DBP7_9GAMM
MNSVSNPQQGTQVKSGDLFGIDGIWINKDQSHHEAVVEAEAGDQVPGHSGSSGGLVGWFCVSTHGDCKEISGTPHQHDDVLRSSRCFKTNEALFFSARGCFTPEIRYAPFDCVIKS